MLKHLAVAVLAMGVAVCARGAERYTQKHQIDAKHMIVVAEGEHEPRSTGSYSIRLYEILSADTYAIQEKRLKLLAEVAGLAKDTDPVVALRQRVEGRKRRP